MITIKRILCPTDLTKHSENAVRYALALARAHDAELLLYFCDVGGGNDKGEIEAALAEQIEAYDLAGIRLVVTVADDVGEEITRQAQANRVDLIVMRSRRRPHRAALLGSTAESVSRSAPCPVLVMHNDERESITKGLQIELKRVLVAYDFSDFAELALNYGLSLAQEHQAELHLIHVLPARSVSEPEIAWYPGDGETPYHNAARRLQRVVPPEVHLWCEITSVVGEGHPYREILNYAEKNKIDLICLGAHGVGFGMRALFGSNVDRVLRQSPCPVLVARPLKPISVQESHQAA